MLLWITGRKLCWRQFPDFSMIVVHGTDGFI